MDMPDEQKDRKREEYTKADNIRELKRRMYSRERTGFLPWRRRRQIPQERPLASEEWEYTTPEKKRPKARIEVQSGVSALLVVAVVFFALAVIGAFAYLRSSSTVRAIDNVDIVIEGPTAVAAGEVVELQVLVTNRNDVPLELADLVVTYPEGTVSPADFRTPLASERIPLGYIEARSARRGAIRAVVLGQNGAQGTINVELQYRMGGASALYTQETNHLVLLTSDAVALSIKAPQEAVPGQETTFEVNIVSQSGTILQDVLLKTHFPFGFIFVTASPEAQTTSDSAQWRIGVLRPGEERTVYFTGTMAGQAGDERQFIVEVGAAAESTTTAETALRQVLTRGEHTIAVHKPFLAVELLFDEATAAEAVASAGKGTDVTVNWQNNLGVPITDATIAITLGGSALNKAAVNAGRDGFYRSVDSLLLWDSKTAGKDLQQVAPGASGEYTFTLTPLPTNYLVQIREPKLTFAVHAAGKRLSEEGVPEVLRESAEYSVKVGTDVEFRGYGLFATSPFGALGPMPPKVEYETTYGVVWEVYNTTSDLEEAVVTAALPHYVRWVGLSSPVSEQLIYNKVDNTLTWHIGNVDAGSGVLGEQPRRVAFALGLVPSATQIGTSPDILRNQAFVGMDTYTKQEIGIAIDDVTTNLQSSDQGFDLSHARVVQ